MHLRSKLCYEFASLYIRKKQSLVKWVLIVSNVVVEVCQAVASQELGDNKLGPNLYIKLTAVFSCICLLLSILELVHGAKRWESCYCFYYPVGRSGRISGRFSVWFGLISAAVQFSLNMSSLVMKRGVLKFDQLGLLLSVAYFFTALMGGERVGGMVAKVRCACHGSNEAQGKFIGDEGLWEFECPHCTMSTLDKVT